MTDLDARERAWAAVHEAVAGMPGWAVGPCQHHGETASWVVTAVDLQPRGRQAKREAITASGATEVAALEALATLLAPRLSPPSLGPMTARRARTTP